MRTKLGVCWKPRIMPLRGAPTSGALGCWGLTASPSLITVIIEVLQEELKTKPLLSAFSERRGFVE
jgi:hypothetical protein